jgi:catechol 2,3-dioxygenase-like lactoylglutathione lyase family enzyme
MAFSIRKSTMSINETMKFNHISFPSTDVDATAAFFVRYLGCTVSAAGTIRILKRHDFDIVIERADPPVAWPRNFHIGFEVPEAQDVVELRAQFAADGAHRPTEVIRHPRGSRFFCEVPGGVQVEINTRADADEAFRASFGR